VQPPGPQSAPCRHHLGADSLADLLVAQIGPVKEFQDLDLVFREPVNEVPEAIPLAGDHVQAGPLQAASQEGQGLLDPPLDSKAVTIRGPFSEQLIGDLLEGHRRVEAQAYQLVQLVRESCPKPPEEPREAVEDDVSEIIPTNVWFDSIGGERHPIPFPGTPELVGDPVVARPLQPRDLHAEGTTVRSLFQERQQRDRSGIVSPRGGEAPEIAQQGRIDRVEPFL
jgi:hypothetical protein